MQRDPDTPGGQGGSPPSRTDLALTRQAIRAGWPIPPSVQTKVIQRIVDYLDRDHLDGGTCSDRTVLMAARTLAAFCGLNLKQQAIDLARQKLDGKPTQITLADLVANAEAKAEKRLRERDSE